MGGVAPGLEPAGSAGRLYIGVCGSRERGATRRGATEAYVLSAAHCDVNHRIRGPRHRIQPADTVERAGEHGLVERGRSRDLVGFEERLGLPT